MSPNDTCIHFVPTSERTTLCELTSGQFTHYTDVPSLVTCPNCRNVILNASNHAHKSLETRGVVHIVINGVGGSHIHSVCGVDCWNGNGGHVLHVMDTARGATCSVCIMAYRAIHESKKRLDECKGRLSRAISIVEATRTLLLASTTPMPDAEHDGPCWCQSHLKARGKHTRACRLLQRLADGILDGLALAETTDVDRLFAFAMELHEEIVALRKKNNARLSKMKLAKEKLAKERKAYAEADAKFATKLVGVEAPPIAVGNEPRCKEQVLWREEDHCTSLRICLLRKDHKGWDHTFSLSQLKEHEEITQKLKAVGFGQVSPRIDPAPLDAPTSTDTPPFAEQGQARCPALSRKLPHQKRCLLRPLHRGWAHVFDLDAMKDAKDAE